MDKISKILKVHYDIESVKIQLQQGGWASLAYKVFNEEQSYFLKVYEKNRASTPKLTDRIDEYVPIIKWVACNSELKGKVPVPLLTREGKYKCQDDYGIYLLYDYIDGETIGNRALTGKQVRQLSEIIANLHLYGEEIPIETSSVKEDFHIPFLQLFKNTFEVRNKFIADDIREVISPYTKQINDFVNTLQKLANYLKNSELRMALCHTDLHYWNLMQAQNQLMLIDWEGLKLAPVEADLMFLQDKPYYEEFLRIYRRTHEKFEVNPISLDFYKGRRKLEDIGEFLEQLLFDELYEKDRIMTLNYLREELKSIR